MDNRQCAYRENLALKGNSRVSRVHALSLDLLSCWTLTWNAMASVSTSNDLRGQLGVKSEDTVNQLVNQSVVATQPANQH